METWRRGFYQNLAIHSADGGVSIDDPANQFLAGWIKALIAPIDDEESHFFAIINK